MNQRKEKSRKPFSNMTGPYWLPTQEDANPRNMVDQVPVPESKNLIDDSTIYYPSFILEIS